MVNLSIDGKKVKAAENWTLLETARHHGIQIPTFCFHEAVQPFGACRLCVVELRQQGRSRLVASCVYPAEEGLDVHTNSDRVKNVRKWVLDLLLAAAPASREVQELAAEYGIQKSSFQVHDTGQECIMCGLCVRTCAEVVGVHAISTMGRGLHKEVGGAYMKPSEACVACGSCVTVCPTGA
ncbi:MAG: 2Fe-2S iron-sulfur cluster-binding protein, partial [Desulfarculaceae bacterium]